MAGLGANFEIFIVTTGSEGDSLTTCHLMPTAEDYLARILKPYHLTTVQFLDTISTHIPWDRPPWGITVFPQEYQLAGHVISRRLEQDDLLFSSFSNIKDPYQYPNRQPPPCSFLCHRSKSMAHRLASRSPLFQATWSALKDRSEGRSWICFPPPLPEDWVAEAEARDAALFYTHYVPEDVES